MSFRMPSWAAAPQTTKRREPRPRRAAIACGGPSPRLKPDGLMRRRPDTATPSGVGAVASARTPRVARTRTRGESYVDGTKTLRGFSRSLDSVLSQGFAQSRRGSSRRSVALRETIERGSRLSGESLARRHGDTEFMRGVRFGTGRTDDSSFLRASVTPCETLPLREGFINTERPAAGRREMTGSLASRMPVGFVAHSLAGVWGEAPVQDGQTAGRKKSSLNARSASPATLTLPRASGSVFKTKSDSN